MAEDATTQSSGETASPEGDAASQPEATPTAPLTTEEVEAQWRNRMSQRDRSHAAETKTLREQLSAYEAQMQKSRSEQEQQRLAGMSEAERVAAERDALREQLTAEKEARIAEVRRVKFPGIAADLDDKVLAAMDEARLASLEAKIAATATTQPPSLVDPNSAARTPGAGGSTAPKEKSREELLADLRSQAEGFVRSL